MTKLKIKDEILKYLVNHYDYGDTINISKELKVNHPHVAAIASKLDRKYVKVEQGYDNKIKETYYLLTLTLLGRYFQETSGYRKEARERRFYIIGGIVLGAVITSVVNHALPLLESKKENKTPQILSNKQDTLIKGSQDSLASPLKRLLDSGGKDSLAKQTYFISPKENH
jgi:hypothetical protein